MEVASETGLWLWVIVRVTAHETDSMKTDSAIFISLMFSLLSEDLHSEHFTVYILTEFLYVTS